MHVCDEQLPKVFKLGLKKLKVSENRNVWPYTLSAENMFSSFTA